MSIKSIPAIFLFILFSCANTEESKENGDVNLKSSAQGQESVSSAFPSESGILEYELKGAMNGTEIWYWTDWGDRQRKERHSVMEIMGIRQEDEVITVIHDEKIYKLDEKKRSATLIRSGLAAELSDLSYDSDQMLEEMGGVKNGTEEVLGKECQVWEMKSMMSRIAVWNRLAMHTVTDMGIVKEEMIATRVDLSPDLEGALFDISGYTIQDLGSVEEIMNKY